MYQVKQLAAMTLLSISLGGVGLAKSDGGAINSKAFLLRGPTRPTPVVTMKEASKQKNEFMRMPDLGGEAVVNAANQLTGTKDEGGGVDKISSHHSLSNPRSDNTKSTLRATNSRADAGRLKSLRFGTVKISGAVRLPRVKFARVGVALDLRDEMPSLDFTQKSLKDSGF